NLNKFSTRCCSYAFMIFFFSSRRRHTRSKRDWSSDVCSSDLINHRFHLFFVMRNILIGIPNFRCRFVDVICYWDMLHRLKIYVFKSHSLSNSSSFFIYIGVNYEKLRNQKDSTAFYFDLIYPISQLILEVLLYFAAEYLNRLLCDEYLTI